MGIIQKDSLRTAIISYIGLFLGYINKGILFIIILTPEEIGLVNLLVSVGLLFAQVSNMGTINGLLRFFPYFRDEDRNHYGFPQLMIFISLIGIALSALITTLFYSDISQFYSERSAIFVAYYFWIIPIGAGHVLFLLLETYLKGVFKNVFAVFAKEVLLRIVISISLVLYWLETLSFNAFVILNCLAYFVPLLALFWYTLRYGEVTKWNAKINIPRRFRKVIVGYSLYNYMNTLGATFVLTMDAMMIAAFLGLNSTGVYTTILYLASALQVPYRSLMRVAVPFVPLYLKQRKMVELNELYKSVSSISLIVAVYMFLLVWVSREELFGLLPNDFMEGVWVFLFIMAGRIIDMFFGINGNILMNSKRYKIDMLFTFILLLLVFVLNYLLIPIYGITGAALSTMIAIVSYNLLRLFYVWYHFKLHPFRAQNLMVIGFFGLVLLTFEFLPNVSDNWLLQAITNSVLVTLIFMLPIFYFKADQKLNEYVEQVLLFVRKKLNRG